MKTCLIALLSLGMAVAAFGDIHDPPGNDYGPTRKLGRGIANVLYGWSEIPYQIDYINAREGSAAAASYGVVRGVGRTVARFGVGIYEILFWPIPAWRDAYFPVLPSDVHWIHAGYSEFPPELGFDSKYPYVRHYYGY